MSFGECVAAIAVIGIAILMAAATAIFMVGDAVVGYVKGKFR